MAQERSIAFLAFAEYSIHFRSMGITVALAKEEYNTPIAAAILNIPIFALQL